MAAVGGVGEGGRSGAEALQNQTGGFNGTLSDTNDRTRAALQLIREGEMRDARCEMRDAAAVAAAAVL